MAVANIRTQRDPLTPGPTRIIGILNVTPDSFSDGGHWLDPATAVAHGERLVAAGADIVDVGGESTRPGAERIPPALEQDRVLPVIEQLAARGVTVSVDTMNASTAVAASRLGAALINDVSGGLADPAMPAAAAQTGLPFVVVHWRSPSARMDDAAEYAAVEQEVRQELDARIHALENAGVARDRLVIDPGLGFSKRAEHNWRLLADWSGLEAHGLPVLVGASRKRFLSEVLPEGAPVTARDLPTAVLSGYAALHGAWGVRVHSVGPSRIAIETAQRLRSACSAEREDSS